MKIPIILCSFIFVAGLLNGYTIQKYFNVPDDNSIKFIWNDVEESIPVDGSLIRLEFTDENNVYIGPAE